MATNDIRDTRAVISNASDLTPTSSGKLCRESFEFAPEGLAADGLGYAAVDTPGVAVITGIPAGTSLGVEVHVIDQLGRQEHGPMVMAGYIATYP